MKQTYKYFKLLAVYTAVFVLHFFLLDAAAAACESTQPVGMTENTFQTK